MQGHQQEDDAGKGTDGQERDHGFEDDLEGSFEYTHFGGLFRGALVRHAAVCVFWYAEVGSGLAEWGFCWGFFFFFLGCWFGLWFDVILGGRRQTIVSLRLFTSRRQGLKRVRVRITDV